MAKKLICALLYAEAETENQAQAIAERFTACPYIYFMGTKMNQYYAIYFLPPEKCEWIEYAEDHPQETYGFEKVQVTFLNEVQYPYELTMRIPDNLQEKAPCQSNCKTCPVYGRCNGCPATIYYRPTKSDK